MEEVKSFLAVFSTLIAVAAFIIAINERRNRKKSEKLTFLRNALLGNKQEIRKQYGFVTLTDPAVIFLWVRS